MMKLGMKSGRILFLILILVLGSCGDRLYSLTTVSPGNTYEIQMRETKTEVSPQNPLPYQVFLELEKNGQVMVKNTILHSGDEWDVRFGTIAPVAEWMSEKILRFSREKSDVIQRYDWIEFYNSSSQPLTYVFISWTVSNPNPEERFLLLDVKSNEKIRLRVTSQADEGADLSDIGCFGRFENGKDLTKVMKRFKIIGRYKSPSHYFITVKDSEILIESQEYQPIK
jgi:hypothetical protein